jgi:hypothetical protein
MNEKRACGQTNNVAYELSPGGSLKARILLGEVRLCACLCSLSHLSVLEETREMVRIRGSREVEEDGAAICSPNI